MHILLTNVHLACREEGSSNRNASRDESVETGDESVEAGDKTQQSCYNGRCSMIIEEVHVVCKINEEINQVSVFYNQWAVVDYAINWPNSWEIITKRL